MGKKIFALLAVTCLMFIAVGCLFDEHKSTLLVRVNISGYFGNGGFDAWLIASNSEGQVLAVKEITQAGYIDLRGPGDQKTITLTQCSFFFYPIDPKTNVTKLQASGTTTQSIPVGTTMELKPLSPTEPLPSVKGSVSFKLTEYATSDQPDGLIIGDTRFNYDVSSGKLITGTTFSADITLRNDPSDILALGYKNKIPVFKWIRGVKPGDVITISWNDFTPSKIIATTRKPDYALITGFPSSTSDNGYILTSGNTMPGGFTQVSPIIPSYLEGFDHYVTNVFFNTTFTPIISENISYDKNGTIPSSIIIPEHTMSITSGKTFGDISFQFSQPYTYVQAFAYGNTDTQRTDWYYFAPAGEKITPPKMPFEILVRHPNLTMDNTKPFSSSSVAIYQYLDGSTYQDLIINNITPKSFERFIYGFSPQN